MLRAVTPTYTARSITWEDKVRANARVGLLTTTALVLLAVLTACAEKSPAERVAAERALFRATLNGFLVQEQVVEPEGAGEEGEVEPAGTEEATGEGEETAMVEPQVVQNVLVDILIQHDSDDGLPGVTVEIYQVDAADQSKAHWQLWVDTDGLARATAKQISHTLEDVSYEDGDGFAAEIRRVPEAERGDYQEFEGTGS